MHHFSNYLSTREARRLVDNQINSITLTPTALKQTPRKTLDFLQERGVRIVRREEKGRPRKLSQEEVKRILAIRKCDLSFYKIARLMGLPKSTVFDYFNRYRNLEVSDEDVKDLQIEKARALFAEVLEKNISEEISQLAVQGINSDDIAEMEELLRRLEDIVRFHSL
jgi:predicted transcriptional regulator